MERVRLSEMVLDFNLYPRAEVDAVNRAAITAAIEAGEVMPPIILDSKSKRIIDGFHRYYSYKKVYGEDFEAEAILNEYESEAAMWADAIKHNARHGRRLSSHDIAHIVSKNGDMLSMTALAEALGRTTDVLEHLIANRFAKNSKEPLKGAFRARYANRNISKKAEAANKRAGGFWNALGLLSQLIDHLENDVVPFDDERVIERLQKVYELVGNVLEKREVA